MNPRHRSYRELISDVAAQLRTRAVLRAAAVTLGIALMSVIVAAAAAKPLAGKTTALTLLRIFPVVATLAAALFFISRSLRAKASEGRIALLIEEKCRMEDRLITA